MIHLEPIVFTARLIRDGGQYGDEYTAVATVQKIGSVGYVSGCHGKINKRGGIQLGEQMEKLGMTEMKWRKGRDV